MELNPGEVAVFKFRYACPVCGWMCEFDYILTDLEAQHMRDIGHDPILVIPEYAIGALHRRWAEQESCMHIFDKLAVVFVDNED